MFNQISEEERRPGKVVFAVRLLLIMLGNVTMFVARLVTYSVRWVESKFLFDDSAAGDEQDLKDIHETRIWFRGIMTVFILAALFLVNCWVVLG